MDIEDIIYTITNLLFGKDLISCSRVNHLWYDTCLRYRSGIIRYVPEKYPYEDEVKKVLKISTVTYVGRLSDRIDLARLTDIPPALFVANTRNCVFKNCTKLNLPNRKSPVIKIASTHQIQITGVGSGDSLAIVNGHLDTLFGMDNSVQSLMPVLVSANFRQNYEHLCFDTFILSYAQSAKYMKDGFFDSVIFKTEDKTTIMFYRSGTTMISGSCYTNIFVEYTKIRAAYNSFMQLTYDGLGNLLAMKN